jgi:hypothetical protein
VELSMGASQFNPAVSFLAFDYKWKLNANFLQDCDKLDDVYIAECIEVYNTLT